MILKAWVKHETGEHVLTRPHSFSQAELISAAHCASVLTSLQQMCEYIVVDGPTRADPGGRSVLDSADFNLMVIQLLVTSVRNTSRMMQELSAQGFNTDRIAFVCNRQGRESAHMEISHVEQTLNRTMYASVPDDWKSVSSSINIGRPLKADYERTKVRQAIAQLALKIHSPEVAEANDAGKGGLLGKFFKKGSKSQGAASEAGPATTASTANS
jgi:pilus assembly protein CpaE